MIISSHTTVGQDTQIHDFAHIMLGVQVARDVRIEEAATYTFYTS